MRLLYRPAAIEDIERAADYIEYQLNNPSAAEKLKTTIVKKTALLKDNPETGMKLSENSISNLTIVLSSSINRLCFTKSILSILK